MGREGGKEGEKEVMRSLGKKQGGARVSEELGTGGEEKEEAEESMESGRGRRVMEERWGPVEIKNRRLRKSNSKFKWHLSWPRIQGIFYKCCFT